MRLFIGIGSILYIYSIILIEYVPSNEMLKLLQSIFLNIGAALIGSTAIIFSVILFTLQINHEKIPFGVFKKLSIDKKLFFTFICALVFSISIALFSLSSAEYVSYLIHFAFLLFLIILFCFIYAYNRALKLINPIYQLNSIVSYSKLDLLNWSEKYEEEKSRILKYDFFKINVNWSDIAKQNIIYCNAYAKKLIQVNDHETAKEALKSIVKINKYYVDIKNGAFVRSEYLTNILISQDKFIEDTLEEIRQNIRDALSRNDEKFLRDNFEILKDLHYLYSNITYINQYGDDIASLSTFYLIDGIENSISHDIPDVLLFSMDLLREIARKDIIDGNSRNIVNIIKLTSDLVCIAILDKKLKPIFKNGLDILSIITIELLGSKENNINYVLSKMNEFLYKVTEMEIQSTEDQFSICENIYYSNVSNAIIDFVNTLDVQDYENNRENLIKIIENIEKWSNKIRNEIRKLFKESLEHNLRISYELICFISNISKSLLFLSTHEIIDTRLSSRLRKNALFLIYIFTFIKEDEKTIMLLEMSSGFTDEIFNIAIVSNELELDKIMFEVRDILLSIGFRGQQVDDQNRILAKALAGSIYINILAKIDSNDLLDVIKRELDKYSLTKEMRSTVIGDLQNMFNIYSLVDSSIEKELNDLENREELKKYINLISKLFNKDAKIIRE